MQEPIANGDGPLTEAAKRFEEALSGLEEHLNSRLSGDEADREATDEQLGQLSSELSQARRRERVLRDAAAEASAALGRAADEVRAVLASTDESDDHPAETEADEGETAE